MKRLAIDVGGTFTDFVLLAEDGTVRIEKSPSLPDQPDSVFFDGINRLGLDLTALETIVHGSTMVINSVVQERGAPVGLLTNAGYRDVLELARGNRLEIYDLFYQQPEPLVPRYLRRGIRERVLSDGSVRNAYTVKIINKANAARNFIIRFENEDGVEMSAVGATSGSAGEVISYTSDADAANSVSVPPLR